jgi:hypothetical protein
MGMKNILSLRAYEMKPQFLHETGAFILSRRIEKVSMLYVYTSMY